MSRPAPTPRFLPPLRILDTLELLRIGALSANQAPTIALPDQVAQAAIESGQVEIVDLEDVPLARYSVGTPATSPPGAPVTLLGVPQWLSEPSPRPFAAHYLTPAASRALAGADEQIVVIDRPLTPARLADYQRLVGARPVLLAVLTGPSHDPGAPAAATLRSALTAATAWPGARVVAIPLAPADASADPALLTTLLAAYSPGSVAALPPTAPAESAGTGDVVFFTGLSGSGKSTIARAVRDAIIETTTTPVTLLDGDVVRRHLSAGLSFSPQDRDTNIRRIGWVAAELAYHGGITIASPIAPHDATRRAVRELVTARGGRFHLVYISTPLAVCQERDRKGLYAKALRGEIPDFTGVSAPYDVPTDADLVIDASAVPVEVARDQVMSLLAGPEGAWRGE